MNPEREMACHLLDAPTWDEAVVRLMVYADWMEENGRSRWDALAPLRCQLGPKKRARWSFWCPYGELGNGCMALAIRWHIDALVDVHTIVCSPRPLAEYLQDCLDRAFVWPSKRVKDLWHDWIDRHCNKGVFAYMHPVLARKLKIPQTLAGASLFEAALLEACGGKP